MPQCRSSTWSTIVSCVPACSAPEQCNRGSPWARQEWQWKEAHLCAIWAPALIAGFETFVHMISLRGRCVSGQGCVLWSVVPARCHPHGQSTNESLQLSTPSFFFFAELGLAQLAAPMRAISVRTFLWALKPMFCRAGRATLISTAARSVRSCLSLPLSSATLTVLVLTVVPLRATGLTWPIPLDFAMWSSAKADKRRLKSSHALCCLGKPFVLIKQQRFTVLFNRCCLMFFVWCCMVPPSLVPLNVCLRSALRCASGNARKFHNKSALRTVGSDSQSHA